MNSLQEVVNRLQEIVKSREGIQDALFKVLLFIVRLMPLALSLRLMYLGEPYWAIVVLLWSIYLDGG